MKAIVVGGGIGGLATALSLHHLGIAAEGRAGGAGEARSTAPPAMLGTIDRVSLPATAVASFCR